LRLNFQEIHVGTIINNINSKIYNNSYLSSFIIKMEFALTCALLKASVVGRQDYIIHLFKIHLNDKIKLLENRMTNLIDTSEEYALVDNILEKTKECLFEMNSDDPSDFKSMFDLKNICNKDPSAKIINYDKIIILLKIEIDFASLNKTKFIKFLYDNLMINSIKIDTNEIKFNWRDISLIIFKFLDESPIKDLFVEYYNEIEKSYELIIKNISFHTEKITGNRKTYNLCMNNVKDIITLGVSNTKNKVITNLEEKVDTLEEKVNTMCTELNNLKIDNEALRNQIRLLKIASDNKIIYNHQENPFEIRTELILTLNKQILPPSPTKTESECDGSDFDCISEYECKSDY
jgi:hypothetical protein